jgi:hypothetical protein
VLSLVCLQLMVLNLVLDAVLGVVHRRSWVGLCVVDCLGLCGIMEVLGEN